MEPREGAPAPRAGSDLQYRAMETARTDMPTHARRAAAAIPMPVLVLLLALALPPAASAAGLRISPVRLDLSRSHPSSQVELSNLTGAPVAVQIRAYAWTQVDGEDRYEPTKDLFFAPPIVTVPAQGRTAVRFRLRAAAPAKAEAAYRVYFQELPPPGALDQPGAGATFRIRFGVPVFVLPDIPVAPALRAQPRREAARVSVDLENPGALHLKIEGVDVFPAGVDRQDPGTPLASGVQGTRGGAYLLPGSRGQWAVDLPATAPAGALLLRVRTDDYSGRANSGILKNGWHWQSLPAAAPAATPAAPATP